MLFSYEKYVITYVRVEQPKKFIPFPLDELDKLVAFTTNGPSIISR